MAKSKNDKNQNNPNAFEIGREIARTSDIPKALRNPSKWIIPCIPISTIKIVCIVF